MGELTPNPAGLAHRDWDEAQVNREFSLPLELVFLLRARTLEHRFLEMGAQKRETKQAGQWGALGLHSGSWQGAQQSAKWSNLLQTQEGEKKSHLLNTFFSHLQSNLCSCCSRRRGKKKPMADIA